MTSMIQGDGCARGAETQDKARGKGRKCLAVSGRALTCVAQMPASTRMRIRRLAGLEENIADGYSRRSTCQWTKAGTAQTYSEPLIQRRYLVSCCTAHQHNKLQR